jgi:hypothetical protein
MEPETRYARSGSVHIAYQVVGDGDIDRVFVPAFLSNIELSWEQPGLGAFLPRGRLAARIAALAGPDEILASGTVRDLSVGSPLELQSRGEQRLRGVAEPWRIYAVAR